MRPAITFLNIQLSNSREVLQVHLVHCLIQKENALSEKLAIKLGFSYCGDREIDGVLMSDYQIEW